MLTCTGCFPRGNMRIVEVRASVNLHALTIEQVISKRRKLLVDMAASMRLEVRDALRRHPSCACAPAYVALCGEWLELHASSSSASKCSCACGGSG